MTAGATTETGRRLSDILPHGRLAGPMPWIIAIMMFLTVLAAAAAIGLASTARALGDAVTGQFTVQFVTADQSQRDQTARRIAEWLRAQDDVADVAIVQAERIGEQLQPWLGDGLGALDIPLPALIDARLAIDGSAARKARLAELANGVAAVADGAQVQPHADYLAPLGTLVRSIGGLAMGIVALMVTATGAVVFLAARAAYATHKGTIDILHMMGATDVQVARLFQRRITRDAAFGSVTGAAAAVVALLILGQLLAALASGLMPVRSWPMWSWALLALLPLAGIGIAFATARFTVLRILRLAL